MTAPNSDENPVPVRQAAQMLRDYLGRLGNIWVEGQVAQLRRRKRQAYLTLRDTESEISIPVVVGLDRLDGSGVDTGNRIVVDLKLEYWNTSGQLQWRARQLQPLGEGALLRQLAALKKTLAAEGLFADERKRPLPFVPRRVGLICGRRAAAHDDVVTNARLRWPTVEFELREVAVQGAKCVPEVVAALSELDRDEDVDVIVITRGGGSFEDLLGFSNEALLRAVSGSNTPVVSAIGHEEDNPLLDLVADVRASTPTAAGKLIVPDAEAEIAQLNLATRRLERTILAQLTGQQTLMMQLIERLNRVSPAELLNERRREITETVRRIYRLTATSLSTEQTKFNVLRQRPVLARPDEMLRPLREDLDMHIASLRRVSSTTLGNRQQNLAATTARLAALSPQGTLDRGYAVVRRPDGALITDATDVKAEEPFTVRVRSGSFAAIVAES